MILRDYQQECKQATLLKLNSNRSVLNVLATGTGKTVIFCSLIRDYMQHPDMAGRRVMIIVPTRELASQAMQKVVEVTGDEVELEMGESKATRYAYMGAPVVVASIQSLVAKRKCRMCNGTGIVGFDIKCSKCTNGKVFRMSRLDPEEVGLIIIDEAHLSVAPSYLAVLEYFGANPNLKWVGFTATPDRADNRPLGRMFETVGYEYNIKPAIDDGYLVPIDQEFCEVPHLDFSHIKSSGDISDKAVDEEMRKDKVAHEVVSGTIKKVGDKKTLVFTARVAQAEKMCHLFREHKGQEQAYFISGSTPAEERKEILRNFKEGRFQFLVGCDVLTAGFDEPSIEVIANARPTKSRALYTQIVGRGTRPVLHPLSPDAAGRKLEIQYSSKPKLLVLDFVGNSGKHKFMSAADILGGDYSKEVVALAIEDAKKASAAVDVSDSLERASNDERLKKYDKSKGITAEATVVSHKVDPFDVYDVGDRRVPPWHRGRELTDKQIGVLKRSGVTDEQIEQMTYTQSKRLIKHIFERRDRGLCSLKQAKQLARFGYPKDLPFDEAKAILDKIAANNWKPIEDELGV